MSYARTVYRTHGVDIRRANAAQSRYETRAVRHNSLSHGTALCDTCGTVASSANAVLVDGVVTHKHNCA